MPEATVRLWEHPDVASTNIDAFRRLANDRHQLNLCEPDLEVASLYARANVTDKRVCFKVHTMTSGHGLQSN